MGRWVPEFEFLTTRGLPVGNGRRADDDVLDFAYPHIGLKEYKRALFARVFMRGKRNSKLEFDGVGGTIDRWRSTEK